MEYRHIDLSKTTIRLTRNQVDFPNRDIPFDRFVQIVLPITGFSNQATQTNCQRWPEQRTSFERLKLSCNTHSQAIGE